MNSLGDLSVKIFADGADLDGMFSFYRDPLIKGLTTNPTPSEMFAQDAETAGFRL
jgi:transaldolase